MGIVAADMVRMDTKINPGERDMASSTLASIAVHRLYRHSNQGKNHSTARTCKVKLVPWLTLGLW